MDDRVPSIDNVDGPNSSNWKVQLTTLVKAWRLWKKHWSLPGTLPQRQVLVTQVENHVDRAVRVWCACCEVCRTRSEVAWNGATMEASCAADARVGQLEQTLSLPESCVLRVESRRTVLNFGDGLCSRMSPCKMDSVRDVLTSQRYLGFWTEGQLALSCIAQTYGASWEKKASEVGRTVIKLQLTRKCSSRTRTNLLRWWEAWTCHWCPTCSGMERVALVNMSKETQWRQ